MQNKIKIKYVLHNLCGCELCDSMTLRMCIQFVGCMGNPKKCMKTMVVFIEKGGCERVKEGWKGLLFCLPPAASRACQPCFVSLC